MPNCNDSCRHWDKDLWEHPCDVCIDEGGATRYEGYPKLTCNGCDFYEPKQGNVPVGVYKVERKTIHLCYLCSGEPAVRKTGDNEPPRACKDRKGE